MDSAIPEVRQMRALIDLLKKHDHAYHAEDNPQITDAEFDSLKRELQALEASNPEFIQPDSPTSRVGQPPLVTFAQGEHQVPMLSLRNIYTWEELVAFDHRVRSAFPGEPIEYDLEYKLDGLAVSLIYRDGILSQALTRGDGQIGEDVTHTVRTIRNLPTRLTPREYGVVEVRGVVRALSQDVPPPLHLLTFCVLVLKNGFTVTGESACVAHENFNAAIGREIARENAVEKIWPLLGYELKQKRYEYNPT